MVSLISPDISQCLSIYILKPFDISSDLYEVLTGKESILLQLNIANIIRNFDTSNFYSYWKPSFVNSAIWFKYRI